MPLKLIFGDNAIIHIGDTLDLPGLNLKLEVKGFNNAMMTIDCVILRSDNPTDVGQKVYLPLNFFDQGGKAELVEDFGDSPNPNEMFRSRLS